MNTQRPTVLIATGATVSTLTAPSGSMPIKPSQQSKARVTELPSPPLSPRRDDDAFGTLVSTTPFRIFESTTDLLVDDTNSDLSHRHSDNVDNHLRRQSRSWSTEKQEESKGYSSLPSISLSSTTETPTETVKTLVVPRRRHSDVQEMAMPTREWIKMQSHIDSLETEISHVARTNELLNQELDKVNGHLERLTSDEGEGWRKEYEFLVQQIDVMHRQLQFAYSQMGRDPQQQYQHQQGQHSSDGEADGQPETAMQLRQEIKELSSSLKSWKTAFHTTEENYRRKCEGERALKQALQQREAQLSSLVERLGGYDSGSQRSIANHQDLLRLSTGLEELQSKNYLTSDASTPEEHSLDSEQADSGSHGEDRMPGVFPEGETLPSALSTAGDTDRLSSSILSWTTLLATYMLS